MFLVNHWVPRPGTSPPLPGGGGDGSGGAGGRGGRLKNGSEIRKREVRPGLVHRSHGVRSVGWEGQEKRCPC